MNASSYDYTQHRCKRKKNPHKQFFTAKKAYGEDEWDGSDVEDVGGWK